MKKNELKKIIRGIVREEVEFALKKELTEIFKSLKAKPITETRRVVKKKKPMKLAKDPVLNKLLNETRGGIPQGEGQEEYPTMGGKTYDTNSMASLMGYGDVGGGSNRAEETIAQMGVSSEQVPDGVKDAITKDYSGLMKAMDKRKKGGVK